MHNFVRMVARVGYVSPGGDLHDLVEEYLLSADVDEDTTAGRNVTTITNEVTSTIVCEDKQVGDTCDIGDISLDIKEIIKDPTTERVRFKIHTYGGAGALEIRDRFLWYINQDINEENEDDYFVSSRWN